MTYRAIAIIQARMASSRLPGKVLMDIGGAPMLRRVVERTRRARTIQDVVLATSSDPSDDPIAQYCESENIPWSRGSHFDVLDRYYKTAKECGADLVVRITADCPLIDPSLIDDVVELLRGGSGNRAAGAPASEPGYDFVANRLPPPWKRTYPIGLDTEACSFDALERAWRNARGSAEREHVMPYLYDGVQLSSKGRRLLYGVSRNGFRIAVLNHMEDLGSQRWTVDTAEDLQFVCSIYERLQHHPDFSWLEVLGLLREHPELLSINAGVSHKTASDVDERSKGTAGL